MVTPLGNLVLAIACGGISRSLRRASRERSRWWRMFFFNMALAFLAGIPKHAFPQQPDLPFVFAATWLSGLFAGYAIYSAMRAVVAALDTARGLTHRLVWCARVHLTGLVALLLWSPAFPVVLVWIGPGLVVVLVGELWLWRTRGHGHGWISTGLIMAIVPAATYVARWPQHEWFNHVDLGHVLILGSLLTMAQGARKGVPRERTLSDWR